MSTAGPSRIAGSAPDLARAALRSKFDAVRSTTERLMAPLCAEDFRAQPIEEVSPPYWNLGHTSWFFATNLLRRFDRMPGGFDQLDYALNSYYEGLGPRLERGRLLRRSLRASYTDAARASLAQRLREMIDRKAPAPAQAQAERTES